MKSIKVEIDLDLLQIDEDGSSLQDLVINQVAREVLVKLGRDEIYLDAARRRVAEIRDEEIRSQIRPQIEDALNSLTTRTNAYGEPVGEPTTLRELIVKQAQDTLKAKQGDHYSKKGTLLEELLRKEVERQFTNELKKEIDAEKEKTRMAVRAAGAEVIADTIQRMAGHIP